MQGNGHPKHQHPFGESVSSLPPRGLLCDPGDHLRECRGSPGPKSKSKFQKKKRKESFGGALQKSPENTGKKSKNTPKLNFLRHFLTFSGIFGDFFADPRKDSV